jgi:hypothetical protein
MDRNFLFGVVVCLSVAIGLTMVKSEKAGHSREGWAHVDPGWDKNKSAEEPVVPESPVVPEAPREDPAPTPPQVKPGNPPSCDPGNPNCRPRRKFKFFHR